MISLVLIYSAHWLADNTSVSTGVSMYVQDSDISWSIEVGDQPSSDQFFGLSSVRKFLL